MKTAILLLSTVSAWWETGHLLTARRAYDILSTDHPFVLEQAGAMLEPLKANYPEITENEKDYPFVECATFADVIMNLGYMWQFTWHFKNTPILNEPNTTLADFPDFALAPTNNVEALGNLTNFLMDRGDYRSSIYMQEIAAKFATIED